MPNRLFDPSPYPQGLTSMTPTGCIELPTTEGLSGRPIPRQLILCALRESLMHLTVTLCCWVFTGSAQAVEGPMSIETAKGAVLVNSEPLEPEYQKVVKG